MKKPKLLFVVVIVAIAVFVMFAFVPARASEVKVIANFSVKSDTISVGELKKVFLEENNSLGDGTHVQPVIEKDGPVHEAFLQAYMGRTEDDLQSYYRTLVFTGKGSMPKELGSDAEVVAYVSRTRGAIGYVSPESSTEGVKTLVIVRAENGSERKLITRVKPDYPETLRRLSIGGTVRLQVTIAAKGNVENVQLLGGNPILGESAMAAVMQWVYAAGHSRTIAEVSVPFDAER
jgi:TonB family protein